MTRHIPAVLRTILLGATILSGAGLPAIADVDDGLMENPLQTPVPSGQFISPLAATGATFQELNPYLKGHPTFRANGAIKSVINANQTELLVMTSGYNNLNSNASGATFGQFDPASSYEYIFVYDISTPEAASKPKVKQVIRIPDTYAGLTYGTDSLTFYASGGVDDVVYVYKRTPTTPWKLATSIPLGHAPIKNDPYSSGGIGSFQAPNVSGLGVSPSGNTIVAANIYNDSISVIDGNTNKVKFEYDLRPFNTTPGTGNGVAGGETPFAVALKGDNAVYVSSIRDRQVVVVDISGNAPKLIKRIELPGNPNSMLFNNSTSQGTLYVTQDNSDRVAVIDTVRNEVTAEIDTIAPPGVLAKAERYTGAAANNLAISPDEQYLYVTNGGANSLAVIALMGPKKHQVLGLIPTGWYPDSVSVGGNGAHLYVVNGKSDPGPNHANLTGYTGRLTGTTYPGGNAAAATGANAANEYIFQLEHGGLLALPTPADKDRDNLTNIVAANNGYKIAHNAQDDAVMSELRKHIKHVIYIVKENRTFDQVLGDLKNGANADPRLTVFGRAVTPSFHALAENFVTLDNFYDSGEVSGNGWAWSTQSRETDMIEKTIALDYASSPINPLGRGAPYDSEGQNRNVDVGQTTIKQRESAEPGYSALAAALPGGAANLLPGTNDDGAPDGPAGTPKQSGYLWNSAFRAGLTVRNYGFLLDLGRYFTSVNGIPLLPDPHAAGVQVAFSTNPALLPVTDPFFRGFDSAFPDVFRFREWEREFDGYVANGKLPGLSLVRLMHDHMGSFGTAIAGFTTPETQQADNDYAVGLLVDRVAHSPYAGSTLIFVIEDDAQDGPDHVDAHRSTAYVVGPYVKHNAVVKTRYTTVSMVRTIEDVLGIDHLNLNDAYQRPMTDVFDVNQPNWTFHALASSYLQSTSAALLTGIDYADNQIRTPTHPASYWAEQTAGFDWSAEDRIPAALFNQVLWDGLVGGQPYPTLRSGIDLSNASN